MFFTRTGKSRITLFKEIALSCVIAFYLYQAIASISPDSSLKEAITDPVKNYWNFVGLTQNWALFSPIIRNINYHAATTITFENGEILLWQLPRMDRLDLYQRFRLEKFRKWDVDSLPWPDYKSFWPDFARCAGRLYYSPTNKPKQCSLFYEYTEIPPASDHLTDRYELPVHNKPVTVFTYFFKPEDFK
jgi:hypothetical protein